MTAHSVPVQPASPETATAFSIFEGLELAGVTPAMISRFCDAEPDQVAGWRRGDIAALTLAPVQVCPTSVWML
jgi:hypothetical protein